MRVLIVEDDVRLGESLTKGLSEEGMSPFWVKSGQEARDLIFSQQWEVIVLDVMLPGISGIQLCEMIRFKKLTVPILMLSALSAPEDKVKALDQGADDYMIKPFHYRELISRINALYRRAHQSLPTDEDILSCADLEVNKSRNLVTRAGEKIELSSKEFNLLWLLLEHKNKVVSRTRILEVVWGTSQATYTNVIDVYISYLRTKIDSSFEDKLIQTVKGRGYMISEAE